MTNKLQITKSKNAGYTLIEMVITITIFMLFLGIVMGSYTELVRANRSANNTQKLYHSVRLIFDTLAQEVRSGEIDYSCIDIDPSNPKKPLEALCNGNQNNPEQKIIAILHDAGLSRTFMRFQDDRLQISHQTRASRQTSDWFSSEWENLSLDEFPFTEGEFHVFPLQNPYTSENADKEEVQYQPSIGITFKIKGITFQTTYASRTY